MSDVQAITKVFWGDTRRRLATWLSIKPQLKCCRPLPIPSAFTMVAGHYSRYTEEGLLPRERTRTACIQYDRVNRKPCDAVIWKFESWRAWTELVHSRFGPPRRLGALVQFWFILVLVHSLCISIHPSSAMTRK
jgi:hypothetical protein